MHRFVFNVNDCLNLTQYGFFFYPLRSKMLSDTASLHELKSITELTEITDSIQKYRDENVSLDMEFQLCFCIRVDDLDLRCSDFYLQLFAQYLCEQLKGFDQEKVSFFFFVVGKDSIAQDCCFEGAIRKGWTKNSPELFPDLSDVAHVNDESKLQRIAVEMVGELSDPVTKWFYGRVAERMIQVSTRIIEHTPPTKRQKEKEDKAFIEIVYNTHAEEISDDPSKEKSGMSAEFETRFASSCDEILKTFSEKKPEIYRVSLAYGQKQNEQKTSIPLVAYLARTNDKSFSDYQKPAMLKELLVDLYAYLCRLNAAYNSLLMKKDREEWLDKEVSFYSGSVVSVPENEFNDTVSEVKKEIDAFFRDEKSGLTADSWDAACCALRKVIEDADRQLSKKAEDVVNRFQYINRRGDTEKKRVRDLLEKKREFQEEKEKISKDIYDQIENEIDLNQKLRMLELLERSNRKIHFLINAQRWIRVLLFVLSVSVAVFYVAYPYYLLQKYVFQSMSGMIAYFGFVAGTVFLFCFAFLYLKKVIRKSILKQFNYLHRSYNEYAETYQKSVEDFTRKLNGILSIRRIEEMLEQIDLIWEQADATAKQYAWHVSMLSEHIDRLNTLDALFSSVDEFKDTYYEDIDRIDLIVKEDAVHNRVYWIWPNTGEGGTK